MKTYHDLKAFQFAVDLIETAYRVTKVFPREELYGLTSQIRRASVGIASNIAEGQGRLSNGEWRQFLSHARGCLFEVEAQMIIATRLGFLSEVDNAAMSAAVKKTAIYLSGLIEYVQEQDTKSTPRRSKNAQ